MFWKTGATLSTEMEGQAIPRMPSNLAAMNVIPGCLVASAKIWFLTARLAICVCVCVCVGGGGGGGERERERERERENVGMSILYRT